MKSVVSTFTATTVFLLTLSGALAQTATVHVQAIKDGSIYAEDALGQGDRGNGRGELLVLGRSNLTLFARRALVAYSLEGEVPAGSAIINASLKMWVSPDSVFPGLNVYRVLEDWAPGTSVPDPNREIFGTEAEPGDVTWLYHHYHADERLREPWNVPGGDFNIQEPLMSNQGTIQNGLATFTSEAFTADVQSLLDDPESHQGWILLGEENVPGPFLQLYYSVDRSVFLDRPVLEVQYAVVEDFTRLVVSFDEFVTVAGKGEKEDRGNNWRSGMEGGDALEAELSRPATARADWEGNIYIADEEAHSVRKVTLDGTIHTVAGINKAGFNGEEGLGTEIALSRPNGIFPLKNGSVYILDTDNDRIRKLFPDGRIATLLHDTETITTGRGLWVSSSEKLVYYASGDVLKKWIPGNDPEIIAEGFQRLNNIDVDPLNGDILVCDNNASRVWRVAADGSGKVKIAGGGNTSNGGSPALDTKFDEVRGIATTAHGGYYLTAPEGGDVWYVGPDTIAQKLIAGSGNGNIIRGEGEKLSEIVLDGEEKISFPHSVTVAPNGDLVVTANKSGLIRVVRKCPGPVLLGSGFNDDNFFTMRWSTIPGKFYVVEGTEDLKTWEVLDVPAANGQQLRFVDQESDELELRYYRVRIYP